jgi:germination protein M
VRALPLLVVAALACLTASCGGGATTVTVTETTGGSGSTETGSTTTPPPTTTQPSNGQTAITVFFLRDGKVAAASREIEAMPAVGTAALQLLADGPTPLERGAGLTSEVQHDAQFALQMMDGTAVVTGPHVSDAASAQIVYTLTQFPTVKTVRINGGNAGNRSDWERLTPPILVLDPTPGQAVTSPVRISGTANTFEATLQIELRDADDHVLAKRFATATSGNGTRGTFDTTLAVPNASPGEVTLVAYEDSAATGKPFHIVRIPLELR